MSDARNERADKWRQEREKQVVMQQLQQQQERVDAEAAAAADDNVEAADRQPSSLDALPEERNLVVIIKADVQVQLHAALTACCLKVNHQLLPMQWCPEYSDFEMCALSC